MFRSVFSARIITAGFSGVRSLSTVNAFRGGMAMSKFGGFTQSMMPIKTVLPSFARPIQIAETPLEEVASEEPVDNTMYMDSVLRKRRLKMKKHKLRKRRRTQRALKKRLGKL